MSINVGALTENSNTSGLKYSHCPNQYCGEIRRLKTFMSSRSLCWQKAQHIFLIEPLISTFRVWFQGLICSSISVEAWRALKANVLYADWMQSHPGLMLDGCFWFSSAEKLFFTVTILFNIHLPALNKLIALMCWDWSLPPPPPHSSSSSPLFAHLITPLIYLLVGKERTSISFVCCLGKNPEFAPVLCSLKGLKPPNTCLNIRENISKCN